MRAVGALDAGYTMYCEEIDWCRRFSAAGWRTECVPAAVVVHHAGASTRQFASSSFAALWRSRRRYFAKYAGWATCALADTLIRLDLAMRSVADRRAVAGGRMAAGEAAERAAAYREVWG